MALCGFHHAFIKQSHDIWRCFAFWLHFELLSFFFDIHLFFRQLYNLHHHFNLPGAHGSFATERSTEAAYVLRAYQILVLIVSELNSRINAEADSISDSSSVPPPPPPAASRNHRQRAPRGQCGQDCKYCSSACSRATAGHGHHSCWTHRHCRD